MTKHYHFIGIGGIGMSALAALVLDKGCKVSGSDVCKNNMTETLREKGASIFTGHTPQNIYGADYIVYSSAIGEDNPELIEARHNNIPLIQRAKLLAELMEGHVGITVAGAHGKTTTTSMVAHMLTIANFHPTTAIGGIVRGADSHGRLGTGDYFVTEVDESDGSFLNFSPFFSIITNIDFEHIDYYPDWQSVINAYKKFIEKTDEIGKIIAFGDDKRLLNLLNKSQKSFKTYGFLPHNNCRAVNIRYDYFNSRFDCIVNGQDYGQVDLKVTGRHNIANALACIGLGLSLALDFDVIRNSLRDYAGVQRRFQLKETIDDIWVIDDYAHHPTEIKAVLDTAKQFKKSLPNSGGELITIIQPHRYSRVKGLMNEFAESLASSDQLIITDIYAASEKPIRGVSARILCNRVRKLTEKPVHYLPKDKIINYLLKNAKSQDIVMMLGAGDIARLSDDFVQVLKNQSLVVEKV